MNSELRAIEDREHQDRQARDMFAAAAFQGVMNHAGALDQLSPDEFTEAFDRVAEICWAGADAMMRKRGGL